VFYLTEGHPIFPQLDRVVWDLYLTRKSFVVIPLVPRGKSTQANQARSPLQTKPSPAQMNAPPSQGKPLPYSFPSYMMDMEALEREIERDKEEGRLPCAVLATVGTTADRPFQSDQIQQLRQLCDRHSLWLHVEGSNLVLAAALSAASSTNAGALAQLSAPFEVANSICADPLEWFQLRATGLSLGLSFVRSSKSHSHHQRHLIPPAIPLSHRDFAAMFTLWYDILAHDPLPSSSPTPAKPLVAGPTFLGSKIHGGSEQLTPSLPKSAPSGDATEREVHPWIPGHRAGESFLSYSIAHHLDVCRYLKSCLSTSPNFNAVVGPGAHHPHVVLFHVGFRALQHLFNRAETRSQ